MAEEKGTTEDEMVGWHHWFNGHEFEQTPVERKGQGSLACCSPWGRKESDTTERLNSNSQMDGVLTVELLCLTHAPASASEKTEKKSRKTWADNLATEVALLKGAAHSSDSTANPQTQRHRDAVFSIFPKPQPRRPSQPSGGGTALRANQCYSSILFRR